MEIPQLIGKAKCVIVQHASGESRSQSIVVGIVERYELGEPPFIDAAVAERPPPPAETLPVEVDDRPAKRGPGKRAERAPAGLVFEGEPPDADEQVLVKVFAVFASKLDL
jgi:hypothetical protein